MDDIENVRHSRNNEAIFEHIVRAGKWTYFFDVKATRSNNYYLTITESKKWFKEEGTFDFQKHKVFLYNEDFGKFEGTLKTFITVI